MTAPKAEGRSLIAHDIDAHDFGGRLVLMDRVHGAAEARSLQPGKEQDQYDDDADGVFEGEGVERDVAENPGRRRHSPS